MKKIIISSFVIVAMSFFSNTVDGQSLEKVQAIITEKTAQSMQQFNAGKIDELVANYQQDACIASIGCGLETIRDHYKKTLQSGFRFTKLEPTSISVSDSIAIEKGIWEIEFTNGSKINGAYQTEWRKTGNDWLIVNDIADISDINP